MKTKLALLLGLTLAATSAMAGSEDWEGKFTIQHKDSGNITSIATHTSSRVNYLFMSAGKCIQLGKGGKINGIFIKEDVLMCTNQNVEDFTHEIEKLGTVIDKSIQLGKTYSK